MFITKDQGMIVRLLYFERLNYSEQTGKKNYDANKFEV